MSTATLPTEENSYREQLENLLHKLLTHISDDICKQILDDISSSQNSSSAISMPAYVIAATTPSIEERVDQYMREKCGPWSHNYGYCYLKQALLIVLANEPGAFNRKFLKLCDLVGTEFNVAGENVHRNMRTVLGNLSTHALGRDMNCKNNNGVITPTNFIDYASNQLRNKQ